MTIHYDPAGEHVVVVTIDRPERRNALDPEHMRALGETWRRFRDDPDARVAIVTGVDRSFCAGGDLAAVFPPGHGDADAALSAAGVALGSTPDAAVMDWLFKGLDVFKPIVAAVNGPCVAGGMEMLTGTDIRIATPHATFGLPEVRRGLIAGGGSTVRLPRQLGWPAAMELLLVGEAVSAERALQLGLINEVVDEDALMGRALDWAGRIAANSPASVQATKESALRNLAAPSMEAAYELETQISMSLVAAGDAYEGARAFVDKRPPSWSAN